MSDRLPLVSIVTPSYNAERFIEETIQSVLMQDYPHIEHIVIDGASTDGTLDILKRYKHLVYVSEPDNGMSDALNKGFQRAKGEIIGWLNADDTYESGAVRNAVEHFLKHPDWMFIYSDVHLINNRGEVVGIFPAREFSFEALLLDNIVPQQGVFFRREVLDEVGGIDPDLDWVMDYEWWLRVGLHYPLQRVPGTWANFRLHRGTKSVDHFHNHWPEMLTVVERLLAHEVSVSELVQQEAFRRIHLRAGIAFIRQGKLDQAHKHFLQAFANDRHPFGDIATLTDYLLYSANHVWGMKDEVDRSDEFFEALFSILPDSGIKRRLRNQVALVRAFRAYQERDLATVRREGVEVLMHSINAWRNRGIVSITAEALLGPKPIRAARKLRRRLFP